MSVHRVWKFGPDIDTDALAPGAYMKLGIEAMRRDALDAKLHVGAGGQRIGINIRA